MSASAPAAAPRHLWWGAVASAVLMLAGLLAFGFASARAPAPASGEGEAVRVILRDGACQPNALSVPAGRTTFLVENRTDRAVEWEILDGVMVVEERENIAPGLSQTLTARLREGTFAITCGLLSNPRGTLTVTPSSAAAGGTAKPALTAFIGPLAEYQVYLGLEGGRAVKGTEALDAAIRAGDLDAARAAFEAARTPYLHLTPVAARFADLRDAMDPEARYLAGGEADPAFTGYRRIEYALFQLGSLDGLAPLSAKLAGDAATLRERLRTLRLAPDEMADGVVRTLRALADTRIEDAGDGYRGADLTEIEATLGGLRKVETLLRPLGAQTAPAPLAELDTRFAALDATLGALKTPAGGYPALSSLSSDQRTSLAADLRALADAAERLNAGLGLGEGGA